MTTEKIYYSVSTQNEKVWIRADSCEIVNGCLAFYDIEGDTKVLISAFPADYWKFIYEADPETGESITAQIPFWKKHQRMDDRGDQRHDPRDLKPRENFKPNTTRYPDRQKLNG